MEATTSVYDNATSLEKWLEADESEEYRDDNFHYAYLDCDNCSNHDSVHPIPYWIDSIDDRDIKTLYSMGSKGVYCNGNWYTTLEEKIKGEYNIDYTPPDNVKDLFVQYVEGFSEWNQYGDMITEGDDKYIYIDSIALPEEIEHQAESGDLVYEYRGSSFLRVLWKVV